MDPGNHLLDVVEIPARKEKFCGLSGPLKALLVSAAVYAAKLEIKTANKIETSNTWQSPVVARENGSFSPQ